MHHPPWSRWAPAEVEYLLGHSDESNDAIAGFLRRDASAVRRKRYALGLKLSPARNAAVRRAVINNRVDVWTAAQLKLLEDHGRRFLDSCGRESDAVLKQIVDRAGPPRSLRAIQLMRSKLGITETKEANLRRLRNAAKNI